MEILKNHSSFETAYKVENYPYGFRLRTSIFYWIESVPKRGDRFCTCTINPKNGRLNAVKKSTFAGVGFMYLNDDNHVKWSGVTHYTEKEKIEKFVVYFGGVDALNPEQKKMYNQLLGINEVKRDEFTDKVIKDYSVKWERETIGNGWIRNEEGKSVWNSGEKGNYDEVKITFDRPDGVQLKEIYLAMKGLNQERLNQVFAERPSISSGTRTGVVRICCRNGVYLGEIKEESYREFLASDFNVPTLGEGGDFNH